MCSHNTQLLFFLFLKYTLLKNVYVGFVNTFINCVYDRVFQVWRSGENMFYRVQALKGEETMKKFVFIFALIAFVNFVNAAETITLLDYSQNWGSYVRNGASQEINTDQPRNGNGSLMQSTTSGSDKAIAYFNTGTSLGTLGDFAAGNTVISFDYYRDGSSTAAAHLAPAFELAVSTDSDTDIEYYIKWEAAYNNGTSSIVTDIWNSTGNIANENWWIWDVVNGQAITSYNYTLADWSVGSILQDLNGDASVLYCDISLGSGWNDSYLGYVDNVSLTVAGGTSYVSNFESVAAVPAPGAILLAGLGTACVGRIRRFTK